MTNRGRFLRWALFAPAVGPLLGVPLLAAMEVAPPLGLLGLFLIGSASYAWTSYLVLAVGVLIWARHRDDARLEYAACVLPLIYAPVAGVHMAAGYHRLWFSGLWWSDFVSGILLALFFGYAYAFLVLLGSERFEGRDSARTAGASDSARAGT